jgi:hypothetical protein
MKNLRLVDNRMPPFCWQEKAVVRKIREKTKTSEIATALAIYGVLTELASNFTSDEFDIKTRTIAKMVGRSERSAGRYLSKLEKIGAIKKKPLIEDGECRCLTIVLVHSVMTPTEGVGTPMTGGGDMGVGGWGHGCPSSLEEHTGRRTHVKKAARAASREEVGGEGRKILRTILHGFPGDLEENIDLIFDSTPDLISASTVAREAARWAERGNMRSPKRALETVIQQVLKKRRKS